MVDLEEHPVLEQIVSWSMYPVDIGFIVYDLLTIWMRDAESLRPLKKKLPFLACRAHYTFGTKCKPARKYYHTNLFFCKHYNSKTGECTK